MEIKDFNELYGKQLDTSQIKSKKIDIKYGPYERNLLDIYYPEQVQESYPTIVFFVGGGFIKGDKKGYQLAPVIHALEKGYIVVSVAYRLAPEDLLPKAIYDAKCATRYLKANASQLKIDKKRMVVWGESAGAVLATHIGLHRKGQLEDLTMGHPTENLEVQAVVDWYGPIDLVELVKQPKEKQIIVDGVHTLNELIFDQKGQALIEAANALEVYSKIDKSTPAFLIEHGIADEVVDYKTSVYFYEKLRKKTSAEVKLHLIEGAKHGIENFYNEENLNLVFDFIDRNCAQ